MSICWRRCPWGNKTSVGCASAHFHRFITEFARLATELFMPQCVCWKNNATSSSSSGMVAERSLESFYFRKQLPPSSVNFHGVVYLHKGFEISHFQWLLFEPEYLHLWHCWNHCAPYFWGGNQKCWSLDFFKTFHGNMLMMYPFSSPVSGYTSLLSQWFLLQRGWPGKRFPH